MSVRAILRKSASLASIFGLAAIATAGLFIVMLALITARFERPAERQASAAWINANSDIIKPALKAELLDTALSPLLEPVAQPPALDTKSPSVQRVLPAVERVVALASSLPSARPELTFNTPSLLTRQAPVTETSLAGKTAMTGRQHCTLAATIGPTRGEVAQIEFMDCVDREITESAEQALYKWVHTGQKGFTDLGAQVGDKVVFTYEKKRQKTDAG